MATETDADGWRRWRWAMWGALAALLILPLAAMQFTREVAWDLADFLFAGGVLIGAGLIYEVAAWRLRGGRTRAVVAAALVALVLLIWADAAVGVF